ncbi:MAG: ParB/RepB/Spo0J family partition protein [Patescibacteria group bacterium]
MLPENDRSKGQLDYETGLCEFHGGVVIEEVETPLQHITLGDRVLEIPVDQIAPLPDQPRKHFDQERINALADSIRHRGQVQPGLVVETPDLDWKYELRDGERRLRACKIAGVPFRATVQTSKDKGRNEALLTSAVANFNREGHTPWEEIDLARRLLEPCPDTGVRFTQAQVSESLGQNNSVWLSNRKIAGERLCQHALEHVADNPSIPFSIIKQVADLPDEEQVQAFIDYKKGNLGVQKLMARAGHHRRASGISRQKKPSDSWDQGKSLILTLDERAQRVTALFSLENITGDLKQLTIQHGAVVADDLERIASILARSARIIRAAR